MCHMLQVEATAKFPSAKYTVVSGFYFLRFLIPAIVAPEGMQLVEGSFVNPIFHSKKGN